MPSPSIVFGFILATLYGSSSHLIAGGDARRLAYFLLAGWLGFALGQIIGDIFQINLLKIGVLHFFMASLFAWVSLFLVGILTARSPDR